MKTIQLKYEVGDTVYFMLGNRVRFGVVSYVGVTLSKAEPTTTIKYKLEVGWVGEKSDLVYRDEHELFSNKQEVLNSL